MSRSTPQIRYHAPSRQFYVFHKKKRVYLGTDGAAAEKRFEEWKARVATAPARTVTPVTAAPAFASTQPPERTVAEVLAEFLAFAKTEYAHNKATVSRIVQAVDAVCARFAGWSVSRFRGPQLKAVRAELVAGRTSKRGGGPISRTYVNYLTACVQRAWKWALSEDLVPADAAASLLSVKPLGRGKGGREPVRVLPPAAGWDECLVELPPLLSAMVRVQALCGCRPQDVCRMRRGELSTAPAEKVTVPGTGRTIAAQLADGKPVWFYAPSEHKTSWKGKPRVIAMGPRAQALLAPLLEGLGPDDHVFSPAKALEQAGRGNRFKREGYGTHYATRQYAQLVERAIERANRPRVRARWKEEELVPHWAPNQLRHLAATVVGDEIDREHARALLGHTSDGVIDRYMEQQVRKAARAAAECG